MKPVSLSSSLHSQADSLPLAPPGKLLLYGVPKEIQQQDNIRNSSKDAMIMTVITLESNNQLSYIFTHCHLCEGWDYIFLIVTSPQALLVLCKQLSVQQILSWCVWSMNEFKFYVDKYHWDGAQGKRSQCIKFMPDYNTSRQFFFSYMKNINWKPIITLLPGKLKGVLSSKICMPGFS